MFGDSDKIDILFSKLVRFLTTAKICQAGDCFCGRFGEIEERGAAS
jgi:hypothetical protein